MFFDCIIITYNYDMYMLRSYATEHWQRAGGEENNRHAILRLCSSKTSALRRDNARARGNTETDRGNGNILSRKGGNA